MAPLNSLYWGFQMKMFMVLWSVLFCLQTGFASEIGGLEDIRFFDGFDGVEMDDPELNEALDKVGANFVDRHGPGWGPGRPGPGRPGPGRDRWPRPDRHRPPIPGPWQKWTCYFENARRMVFVGEDFNYNYAYSEAQSRCQRASRWCYFIHCRR